MILKKGDVLQKMRVYKMGKRVSETNVKIVVILQHKTNQI